MNQLVNELAVVELDHQGRAAPSGQQHPVGLRHEVRPDHPLGYPHGIVRTVSVPPPAHKDNSSPSELSTAGHPARTWANCPG